MIILHELPFRFVEHHGFRSFIKDLNPEFKMPHRTTIKADCLRIYEELKQAAMTKFEEAPGRVSFTTDLWTSNQNLGYVTCGRFYCW
jgi:hypothetical protein